MMMAQTMYPSQSSMYPPPMAQSGQPVFYHSPMGSVIQTGYHSGSGPLSPMYLPAYPRPTLPDPMSYLTNVPTIISEPSPPAMILDDPVESPPSLIQDSPSSGYSSGRTYASGSAAEAELDSYPTHPGRFLYATGSNLDPFPESDMYNAAPSRIYRKRKRRPPKPVSVQFLKDDYDYDIDPYRARKKAKMAQALYDDFDGGDLESDFNDDRDMRRRRSNR